MGGLSFPEPFWILHLRPHPFQNIVCTVGMPVCVCSTLVMDSIGAAQALSHGVCHLTIQTLGREVIALNHTFAVMRNITHSTPCFVMLTTVCEATRRLVLADPTFDTCAVVDILLGVDVVLLK